MPRYVFPMSSGDRPIGGRNIILWMINVLQAAGVSAQPIYSRAIYSYPFYPCDVLPQFDRRIQNAYPFDSIWTGKVADRLPSQNRTAPYVAHPSDIMVLPEFRYPELCAVYPNARKLCLVQDVYAFFRAYTRDLKNGKRALAELSGIITTSDACAEVTRLLTTLPITELVLPIDSVFTPALEKKRRIAFMPRKLAKETEFVTQTLKSMPELEKYEFRPIDRMTIKETAREMHDALIFLSFSTQEGFGLPPAEAMASGCIVVGYNGVGGREFFTKDTGFVIEASDLVGFIETVRNVVVEYDVSPKALDEKRLAAAKSISQKYDPQRAAKVLVERWQEIGQALELVT